jgi:Spy/CpxP family protein refolding chaperone
MPVIKKISLAACLLVQAAAFAQTAAAAAQSDQGVSDQDIQLLRKNLRSQRKQLIAANMKLSDTEAEKFWPLYEQYVSDLVKINGPKYELIKQYVSAQGALSDAQADSAVKQWLDIDRAVGDLRAKYVPNFRKVLTAKNTALFYQLDRRIQLMIDLQLASSIPLIEP